MGVSSKSVFKPVNPNNLIQRATGEENLIENIKNRLLLFEEKIIFLFLKIQIEINA